MVPSVLNAESLPDWSTEGEVRCQLACTPSRDSRARRGLCREQPAPTGHNWKVNVSSYARLNKQLTSSALEHVLRESTSADKVTVLVKNVSSDARLDTV